jgi:hypothetical protein
MTYLLDYIPAEAVANEYKRAGVNSFLRNFRFIATILGLYLIVILFPVSCVGAHVGYR